MPAPALLQFEAFLSGVTRLRPASLAALEALMGERRFAAGEYLLQGGTRAEWGFFVLRGLVREHYVGEDGAEHTRSFVAEDQVTGSLLDLLTDGPSVTWIQALEPTATLAFRYRAFDALCEAHPDLHALARRLAEAVYVRKARREHEMLALGAAERHARWLASHAALDARLSRKLVASYLGITPEHLSRLRQAGARRRERNG